MNSKRVLPADLRRMKRADETPYEKRLLKVDVETWRGIPGMVDACTLG
jgi:hypothetical protein